VLQAIDQHKYVLQAATDPKLRGLAVAFVIDPIKNAGAAQALQLAWIGKLPAEVLCPQLEKIGDSYPELLELQLFLARTYLSNDVNDTEAAIAAAKRAARIAPNSPIPYRLLVDATIRAKNWTECLPAARRLRDRLSDDCFEADLAIAKAYVSLGRSEEAANQLASYMNDPKSANYAAALTVISEADKASGGTDAVRKRLRPLLESGLNGRAAWISYALGDRSLPLQESATLLREVAKVISPDSVQELLALGDAWGQLATRSGDASCAKEARAILEPLAAKTDASAPILLVTASRLEQDGALAAAESLYRRVLAAGSAPAAQNNLAMLLVQSGGDLQEAQQLIAAAINEQPAIAALHDTRAFVLAKANDPQAAVASVDRAIQLEPNNAEYRVHLTELLLQSGQRDKAQEAMASLEKMPLALKSLSSKARQRFESLRVAVADRTAAAAVGAESATR
jgi:tetratricopeptide (TPR) repeat protein